MAASWRPWASSARLASAVSTGTSVSGTPLRLRNASPVLPRPTITLRPARSASDSMRAPFRRTKIAPFSVRYGAEKPVRPLAPGLVGVDLCDRKLAGEEPAVQIR